MHFKTLGELKESLSRNVKMWPLGPGEQRLGFSLQRGAKIECHSFDCPMRDGTTKKVAKRALRLTNGDMVLVPPAALRALERINIFGDGPLDVVLKRTGAGLNTTYDAYVQYNDGYDDARDLGILRGKADFSDPVKHCIEVTVHTPQRLSNVMYIGAPRWHNTSDVCRCDIRDLMSTGHTSSCPEKSK